MHTMQTAELVSYIQIVDVRSQRVKIGVSNSLTPRQDFNNKGRTGEGGLKNRIRIPCEEYLLKHAIGETSGDEGAEVRQRHKKYARETEGRDYKPGITNVRVHEEHERRSKTRNDVHRVRIVKITKKKNRDEIEIGMTEG